MTNSSDLSQGTEEQSLIDNGQNRYAQLATFEHRVYWGLNKRRERR